MNNAVSNMMRGGHLRVNLGAGVVQGEARLQLELQIWLGSRDYKIHNWGVKLF